ncbi:MAG TPA: lipase maturation factor family protein [Chthoniobacterales bacterium]|nr:lipase maturation factor family protein [Chthoniobacterales bacterium]
MSVPARVSNPPPKPLLIWDGECHFCRRWIERWRLITGTEVDYLPYQEITERFPEIPREQFQHSVIYIDPDGQVFVAAAAVYRSLCSSASKKWLWWSYQHVPGFAAVSELAYRLVAKNRPIASATTRLLWGKDVRPPTYFWARRWFLSALGLIYLIAFVSLWTQIHGLIGTKGIIPIDIYLANAKAQVGFAALSVLPTLCWISSSDPFLHFLCGGGVILSLLLIIRVAPAISAALLFVFYLSLVVAGQNFLSFQWDILLLETGFLAIFLAPWQLWPRRVAVAGAFSTAQDSSRAGGTPAATGRPWPNRIRETPVSSVALFLLKFLLFKLMLMSGVVKLTSGDNCWGWIDHSFHWNALTALDYHYWTQPLPTIFAWFADKHSEWFKKFSVGFCLFVEIIVPFFIWAPRRIRLTAAGLLIFLQIAIAITGNYCFFNLLTIALCLLLIDDAVWRKSTVGRDPVEPRAFLKGSTCSRPTKIQNSLAIAVLVITLPLNAWHIYSAFQPQADLKQPVRFLYERLQPFYIANGYGLFRVMTKERPEIQVEGSADGIDWVAYEFKWKPGDLNRAPRWCAPHQPRLDWQMWFAALGGPRQEQWFGNFVVRLLENEPSVTRLLAHNPFPDKPPKYVRAVLFQYQFTTSEEHRTTGAWWKRREIGEFFPEASLRPSSFRR